VHSRWSESKRIGSIAGRLVEIDRAIEAARRENPVVDGLAYFFAICREVSCASVWADGGTENLDAVFVCPGNELRKFLFPVFGGELVIGQVGLMLPVDIGDALKHDDVPHSGLRENISIEAGHSSTGRGSSSSCCFLAGDYVRGNVNRRISRKRNHRVVIDRHLGKRGSLIACVYGVSATALVMIRICCEQ